MRLGLVAVALNLSEVPDSMLLSLIVTPFWLFILQENFFKIIISQDLCIWLMWMVHIKWSARHFRGHLLTCTILWKLQEWVRSNFFSYDTPLRQPNVAFFSRDHFYSLISSLSICLFFSLTQLFIHSPSFTCSYFYLSFILLFSLRFSTIYPFIVSFPHSFIVHFFLFACWHLLVSSSH